MLANYGYHDGSGDYFITIDTDQCNGCGDCVGACPQDILIVVEEDPYDPLRDEPVAMVATEKRKNLKYECNACKASSDQGTLPCVKACEGGAISHSW